MTASEYVESILAKHQYKPGFFAMGAQSVIVPALNTWASEYLNQVSYIGSVAKGTAIAGTTDLDIFISLKSNTPHTLKEIYDKLFQHSQEQGWAPQRQNVSIGISYLDAKIDLVPGRLQPGQQQYHSLWRRRANTWIQSAPQVHIKTVTSSGRQREIRALKIWRKNHNLTFPSFLLELAVINALLGCGTDISQNVWRALGYLADQFPTASLLDPSNTNNNVSDDLTQQEKVVIAQRAKTSRSQKKWEAVLW